jgi:hypothetical protein
MTETLQQRLFHFPHGKLSIYLYVAALRRLFQKRVIRTQINIYVVIRLVKQASYRTFMYLTFMFSYSTSKTCDNDG